MLTTNTIQSLLTTSKPWDTTGKTAIEGFELAGIQPADSNRRVIFMADSVYYKLTTDTAGLATPTALTVLGGADGKTAVNATASNITDDYVLTNGNTVTELSAVKSIPTWIGKRVYPIIALDCAQDATVYPTLKIALKTRCNQDQYQKSEESAEYVLAADDAPVTISEIVPYTTVKGAAKIEIQVFLKQNGFWSSSMSLEEAKGKQATAIKYKATYTVSKLESEDSAQIDLIVAHLIRAADTPSFSYGEEAALPPI